MQPILIDGTYRNSTFISLIVLACLAGAAALVVLAAGGPPGVALGLLVIGLAPGVAAVGVGLSISARRRWLIVEEAGFVVRDRVGDQRVADEDVTDLAWKLVHDFSTGVLKSSSHVGRITFAGRGGSEEVPFRYKVPKTGDEVGPLLQRLLNLLVERTDEGINEGGELRGDDWALGPRGLRRRDHDAAVVPFEEMTSVALVDGKVCVWVKGEANAAFRIPVGDRNAQVLMQVLRWRVRDAGAKQDEEQLEEGLGRIIFQRDRGLSPTAFVVLMVLGAVCLVVGLGVIALIAADPPQRDAATAVLVLGGVPLLVAGIMLGVGYFNRVNIFRAHALGLSRHNWQGKRVLRYEEIGTFTWSATRVYVNGAYTGTRMLLRATPLPDSPAEAVTYQTNVKGNDAELDNLRDHIAVVIADRLKRDLGAGRRVRWTDRIAFVSDGLEHRPSGLFSSGETELIPYEDVTNYDMQQGIFRVFVGGQNKPRFTVPVSTPNFFPCLHLLLGLTKRN
jgi:hypothetical protein